MSVAADMEAVERSARRAELTRLVYIGARVGVVNPLHPDRPWKGTIHGLLDEPSVSIDCDDGKRRALPQSFAVIEEPPDPHAEEFPATWAGGHALIIEFGDEELSARCQCGGWTGEVLRPDQFYGGPWEGHVMRLSAGKDAR